MAGDGQRGGELVKSEFKGTYPGGIGHVTTVSCTTHTLTHLQPSQLHENISHHGALELKRKGIELCIVWSWSHQCATRTHGEKRVAKLTFCSERGTPFSVLNFRKKCPIEVLVWGVWVVVIVVLVGGSEFFGVVVVSGSGLSG